MTSLLRVLAVAIWALVLALPGIGGEGGENGSGTGVWVLPRATHLAPFPGAVPRESRQVDPLQDCVLQMSTDVGAATGSLVEASSGLCTALVVTGLQVRIPAQVLQALVATSGCAQVLVADANQYGYWLQVTVANGRAVVSLF